MASATITVYREDDEIEVSVEGSFSFVSSYNPNETGEHLEDFQVVEPQGFQLTAAESAEAEQALYDSHGA